MAQPKDNDPTAAVGTPQDAPEQTPGTEPPAPETPRADDAAPAGEAPESKEEKDPKKPEDAPEASGDAPEEKTEASSEEASEGKAGEAEASASTEEADAEEKSEDAESSSPSESSEGADKPEPAESPERNEAEPAQALGDKADEAVAGNRRFVIRRSAKWGGIALLIVTLAVLIGAALIRWDLFSRPVAIASGEPTVDVFVEEGDTAQRIMNRIVASGLDVTPLELRAAARLHDRGLSRVHAGLYRFEANRPVSAILDRLAEGPLIDQQVRIPDGVPIWTVRQLLADAVNLKPESTKLSDEELRKALGLEAYPSIEGFIAPETYRYGSGTSDLMVLRRAVERQKRLLNEAWTTRSPNAQVKTPYELLILASIIERESGIRSDRHLVSSVFHNRLAVKMPLQTDPTVIYGLGERFNGNITKKDLQTFTPYNTYRITGLPPTPIGTPTPASIEAAAHPAETRYLYFVSRGDGTSEFTTNLKDHNRAVRHFILEKRQTPFSPSAPAPKDGNAPLRAQ